MKATRRVTVALACVAAMVAAGCEPPPPRVPFAVTTTSAAPDAVPGDGICEATPGQGDCTLPAAVTEANAVPAASIAVPAGEYHDMDLTVTGDVELNWGAPVDVRLASVAITVGPGASLRVAGLRAQVVGDGVDFSITVAGALQLDRASVAEVVGDDLGGRALTVLAGGGAVVTSSLLYGGEHGVDTAGSVVIDRSSVFNLFNGRINTTGSGTSAIRASLLSRAVNTSLVTSSCTGTPATSLGFSSYAPLALGCTSAASDVFPTGSPPAPIVSPVLSPPGYVLPASSHLVDAIPLGEGGCDPGTVDIVGNPRGVDGNGDGVPGCDVGAVERQP